MKFILALLLLSSSLYAQDQSAEARAAAGCGPDKILFDVKTDKHQHPLEKPEPGKAIVYVIDEPEPTICIGGCDTFRIGLDGNWMSANQGKSYSYFFVMPGDHNLCIDIQPRALVNSKLGSAVSFTAEPGKAYYFVVRMREKEKRTDTRLVVEPVDNAEGPLLIARAALSNAQQKK
ncbi:MAG TPA: hypothetical protein VFC63_24345 [Blastocatellia bacterium]|nr:hypothetical protein [Blastocatellia bacterium]